MARRSAPQHGHLPDGEHGGPSDLAHLRGRHGRSKHASTPTAAPSFPCARYDTDEITRATRVVERAGWRVRRTRGGTPWTLYVVTTYARPGGRVLPAARVRQPLAPGFRQHRANSPDTLLLAEMHPAGHRDRRNQLTVEDAGYSGGSSIPGEFFRLRPFPKSDIKEIGHPEIGPRDPVPEYGTSGLGPTYEPDPCTHSPDSPILADSPTHRVHAQHPMTNEN